MSSFPTYLAAQLVKNLPAMWETWVQSLGWEDPLEKGKATHYSILTWRISWTATKRREAKGKGEKEIYKHLNADFQRIARRDKEAFLSDQCKEIEENNRGKTRDLFKKTRDTKETLPAKMGSIKDRNCMDLTEAEDIEKRWQEYTEELYKKELQRITMVWSLT